MKGKAKVEPTHPKKKTKPLGLGKKKI